MPTFGLLSIARCSYEWSIRSIHRRRAVSIAITSVVPFRMTSRIFSMTSLSLVAAQDRPQRRERVPQSVPLGVIEIDVGRRRRWRRVFRPTNQQQRLDGSAGEGCEVSGHMPPGKAETESLLVVRDRALHVRNWQLRHEVQPARELDLFFGAHRALLLPSHRVHRRKQASDLLQTCLQPCSVFPPDPTPLLLSRTGKGSGESPRLACRRRYPGPPQTGPGCRTGSPIRGSARRPPAAGGGRNPHLRDAEPDQLGELPDLEAILRVSTGPIVQASRG